MAWSQPAENSVPSISEATNRFDGVEFDLRFTVDGGIILHHDPIVKVDKEIRDSLPSKYVENNTLDDLKQLGFADFDDLMADSDFVIRLSIQAVVP